MKRLWVVLTILSLAFAVLSSQIALANSPQPREDYEQVTKNKEFVFVMLIPVVGAQYNDKPDANLRTKYSRSGLYKNDGSTQPLWAVGWWDYSTKIYVSSDSKHLVRLSFGMTAVGYDALNYTAISFYENGNLLKSYQYSDLIKNPKNLPEPFFYGPWGYSWLKEYDFNDDSNKFTLSTQFGEQYKFDITNGNKVSFPFDLDIPLPFLVIIVALLIGIVGAIFDIRGGKRYKGEVIVVRRK